MWHARRCRVYNTIGVEKLPKGKASNLGASTFVQSPTMYPNVDTTYTSNEGALQEHLGTLVDHKLGRPSIEDSPGYGVPQVLQRDQSILEDTKRFPRGFGE